MKLDVAIESVQDAEASLAKELRRAGERHALQSDLYHLTRMLADRCEQQLERLLPFATRYGAPDTHDPGESSAVVEQVRRLGGELAGRHEASGLVLLDDLRGLYVSAQEAEISWTVLIQGALAIQDRELLEVADECRKHAETRAKWLRTRLKESSPQALVGG